ncbi:MAG: ferredoxin family protein [Rhodobacteraceae bacterium]|nr:ferredoxin family protein [Paracoccaceae bacterium]
MAFVIAEPCIDIKDGICTDVCPVDCIYEGGRMFYIQPDECINCAICESVCPVDAIMDEDNLPEKWQNFAKINEEFFGEKVTGWGQPCGLADEFRTDQDHPVVGNWQQIMADKE